MASINIGETLRKARLQQNISLEELQQITKIQKRYLTALEYNDFDSMPGTFYVRAFIRQYANAVGLDGQYLVDVFNGELNLKQDEPAIQLERVEESRRSTYEEEPSSNGFLRSLPAVIFSLFGLAIAVVVFYITWQNRQADPVIKPNDGIEEVSRSTTSTSTSSVVESSSESSTTTTTSEESKEMKISKTSEVGDTVNMEVKNVTSPVRVQLTGKGLSTWVGVIVNGSYIYKGALATGQQEEVELPANVSAATVIVGVSENIEVQLNAQPVEFQTAVSDVNRKTLVFTLNYLQPTQ